MAGFHVGVRGKAAGRVVRCSAKPGGCRLMGADGAPVPHFASVAEGEAFLAEQEAAQRGGFTGVAHLLRSGMWSRCWGRLTPRLIAGLASGCRVLVMLRTRRPAGMMTWCRSWMMMTTSE